MPAKKEKIPEISQILVILVYMYYAEEKFIPEWLALV